MAPTMSSKKMTKEREDNVAKLQEKLAYLLDAFDGDHPAGLCGSEYTAKLWENQEWKRAEGDGIVYRDNIALEIDTIKTWSDNFDPHGKSGKELTERLRVFYPEEFKEVPTLHRPRKELKTKVGKKAGIAVDNGINAPTASKDVNDVILQSELTIDCDSLFDEEAIVNTLVGPNKDHYPGLHDRWNVRRNFSEKLKVLIRMFANEDKKDNWLPDAKAIQVATIIELSARTKFKSYRKTLGAVNANLNQWKDNNQGAEFRKWLNSQPDRLKAINNLTEQITKLVKIKLSDDDDLLLLNPGNLAASLEFQIFLNRFAKDQKPDVAKYDLEMEHLSSKLEAFVVYWRQSKEFHKPTLSRFQEKLKEELPNVFEAIQKFMFSPESQSAAQQKSKGKAPATDSDDEEVWEDLLQLKDVTNIDEQPRDDESVLSECPEELDFDTVKKNGAPKTDTSNSVGGMIKTPASPPRSQQGNSDEFLKNKGAFDASTPSTSSKPQPQTSVFLPLTATPGLQTGRFSSPGTSSMANSPGVHTGLTGQLGPSPFATVSAFPTIGTAPLGPSPFATASALPTNGTATLGPSPFTKIPGLTLWNASQASNTNSGWSGQQIGLAPQKQVTLSTPLQSRIQQCPNAPFGGLSQPTFHPQQSQPSLQSVQPQSTPNNASEDPDIMDGRFEDGQAFSPHLPTPPGSDNSTSKHISNDYMEDIADCPSIKMTDSNDQVFSNIDNTDQIRSSSGQVDEGEEMDYEQWDSVSPVNSIKSSSELYYLSPQNTQQESSDAATLRQKDDSSTYNDTVMTDDDPITNTEEPITNIDESATTNNEPATLNHKITPTNDESITNIDKSATDYVEPATLNDKLTPTNDEPVTFIDEPITNGDTASTSEPPAPVQETSTPVQESPAPVKEPEVPVQEPAPVEEPALVEEPAPVQEPASPVQEPATPSSNLFEMAIGKVPDLASTPIKTKVMVDFGVNTADLSALKRQAVAPQAVLPTPKAAQQPIKDVPATPSPKPAAAPVRKVTFAVPQGPAAKATKKGKKKVTKARKPKKDVVAAPGRGPHLEASEAIKMFAQLRGFQDEWRVACETAAVPWGFQTYAEGLINEQAELESKKTGGEIEKSLQRLVKQWEALRKVVDGSFRLQLDFSNANQTALRQAAKDYREHVANKSSYLEAAARAREAGDSSLANRWESMAAERAQAAEKSRGRAKESLDTLTEDLLFYQKALLDLLLLAPLREHLEPLTALASMALADHHARIKEAHAMFDFGFDVLVEDSTFEEDL